MVSLSPSIDSYLVEWVNEASSLVLPAKVKDLRELSNCFILKQLMELIAPQKKLMLQNIKSRNPSDANLAVLISAINEVLEENDIKSSIPEDIDLESETFWRIVVSFVVVCALKSPKKVFLANTNERLSEKSISALREGLKPLGINDIVPEVQVVPESTSKPKRNLQRKRQDSESSFENIPKLEKLRRPGTPPASPLSKQAPSAATTKRYTSVKSSKKKLENALSILKQPELSKDERKLIEKEYPDAALIINAIDGLEAPLVKIKQALQNKGQADSEKVKKKLQELSNGIKKLESEIASESEKTIGSTTESSHLRNSLTMEQPTTPRNDNNNNTTSAPVTVTTNNNNGNRDLQLARKIIQSLHAQIQILDDINKQLNEPVPPPQNRIRADSEPQEIAKFQFWYGAFAAFVAIIFIIFLVETFEERKMYNLT